MAENVPAKLTESILPMIADIKDFAVTFAENCEGISPSFDTITVPSGGGLAFNIINEDSGEMAPVIELMGVVIDHHPARAYWPGAFAGGEPPECSSNDAVTGTVHGLCAGCEFAQFGSETKSDGSEGRGQACKFMRRVFILMAGQESVFPRMLVLPPTSASQKYDGSFSTYVVKLSGRMKKLSDVQTKVKLIQDRSADGITYSKTTFFYAGDVNDEDKAKIRAIKAGLGAAMRNKPIEAPPASNGAGGGKEREPWE